jgi:hypothetical protein
LAVARKSGGTRDLARRVEEARTQGLADEPTAAAEKILTLAGALNAHDRMTRGHGERVRVLTDLIAEELELSSDERDRLRWSALLHDIGKLAVHPDILNKPDKLTEEEWEIIKRHPLEGARLTAPLAPWLGEWANTLAEHHEKYDGTGYPYGLKGSEISLGGRIVAVADCYDTMTTVRSYRKPLSPKAARAELAACAGSHFDPRIVRAFLDVSIGKLRPVTGPLAWLGSLPFVASIPQAAGVLSQVGAASLVVTGAVTAGVNATPHGAVGRSGQVAVPNTGGPTGSTGGKGRPSSTGGNAGGSTSSTVTRTGLTAVAPVTTLPGSGLAGGGPGGGGVATTTTTTTTPPVTAPGAPTALAVVAGNGQVTVSWSAPADGGSPITSYTVTPWDGTTAGKATGFAATPTKEIVTGLTNGVAYTFTVTAGNAVGAGPPSAHSPAVTPLAPSLRIVNAGGGVDGQAKKGDRIVVTFMPAPASNAFCSTWSPGAAESLDDENVVVKGTEPASGDDTLEVTDSADCTGGFHFGTIDLGQRGYFVDTVTFGGSGTTCTGAKKAGCSAIRWDGANTLTITLGTASASQPVNKTPSVAVYTPDPALGVVGTIDSTKEEHF